MLITLLISLFDLIKSLFRLDQKNLVLKDNCLQEIQERGLSNLICIEVLNIIIVTYKRKYSDACIQRKTVETVETVEQMSRPYFNSSTLFLWDSFTSFYIFLQQFDSLKVCFLGQTSLLHMSKFLIVSTVFRPFHLRYKPHSIDIIGKFTNSRPSATKSHKADSWASQQ